jgi:Fur family transcriptional regulator, ferric uptake regulator
VPRPTDVPSAINAVRASGFRVSGPRRGVIEALFAAEGPVTAEQLAGGLGGRLPRLDLASVYRNLGALERIGIVDRVTLGNGAAVYGAGDHGPPAVAVCERCGSRSAIDGDTLDRLRALVLGACGFSQAFAHGAVVALCEPCGARNAV